jgi:hypothetical protein
VAVKALPHCQRLQGLLSSRVQHNVGLGLIIELLKRDPGIDSEYSR